IVNGRHCSGRCSFSVADRSVAASRALTTTSAVTDAHLAILGACRATASRGVMDRDGPML
ncbi:MAG TPA: hypothetical protein VGI46_03930, partial [Candidatus Acidoferrum sp.]